MLHLIPAPKSLKLSASSFPVSGELFLLLSPGIDLFPAQHFADQAAQLLGSPVHIAHGPSVNPAAEIQLSLDPTFAPDLPPEIRAQAYTLQISKSAIQITAHANPGIFYALQTLLQIIRETAYTSSPNNRKSKIENRTFLPTLSISDHPDFPRRGVYHDTARGKVPTLATLLQLVDDLAHLKYNEFQLYIENNFQFRKHADMYDDTDPLTAEELLQIDAACRARYIDFVPSLTSLGHFEKILNRPRYRPLAEAEPAQLKAIGATCWHEDAPWSLCVTDPKAKQLLADMYAEFAPNFSSPQFNICCDEAYDLGKVRSKDLADKIGGGGTGQMYVDWINFCDQLVKQTARPAAPQDSSLKTQVPSIQMWGDIILNHPELIAQLPPDATLLEWGYEHDHKFDEHCKTFSERLSTVPELQKSKIKNQKSKIPSRSFYVSPGTSSWLTLSARTKNAFGNIHSAATAGLKYHARGILVTDWGDHGHQQLLAVSLTPFAYGAAAGWNLAATPNPYEETQNAKDKTPSRKIENRKSKIENSTHSSFLTAVSLHLFQDPAAQLAHLAYDLGLTYERLGWQRFNASLDHFLFREKWDFANYVNRAPADGLAETIRATESLLKQFQAADIRHPDAGIILDEFTLTCLEILHTCRRTQLRQHWLAASPKTRNPEEPTRRDLPPKNLPKSFRRDMKSLAQNAAELKDHFTHLWLTRNKKSRLADIQKEFDRLIKEYHQFA